MSRSGRYVMQPSGYKAFIPGPLPKVELSARAAKLLASAPRPHDAKKLAGANSTYRIRSGNYRVLYEVFDRKLRVLVVQIGP